MPKLAAIFGTVEFRDRINFNSSNEDVMKVLDTEIESAIANAFNILRTRIDRFGVVQPNITNLATRGRILIELPGQDDPQRVRELLQGTANLEFWETYENGEVLGYLSQANNLLREIQANTVKTDSLTDISGFACCFSRHNKNQTSHSRILLVKIHLRLRLRRVKNLICRIRSSGSLIRVLMNRANLCLQVW